jgi:ER membrane protein complex subunit 3
MLHKYDKQILVGILRHYVTLLLGSSPKKLTRAAIREQYM